jgi:hypothetical protein
MHRSLLLTGLLFLAAFCANAATGQTQTCAQIREQIQMQTGILPKTNTELLQQLSTRQECRFSAAEVYRAAYGDKPFPRQEPRSRRNHDHDND